MVMQYREIVQGEMVGDTTISDIFEETKDYRALQKENKSSEKTGWYRTKKRFGRSQAGHAQARFLGMPDRKPRYIGKTLNRVNTVNYRASQYRHDIDNYEKDLISTCSKMIAGQLIQGDLYNAFLLMCVTGQDRQD